ncbi:MAG: GNAT family N-acetyltransferase [Syntrophales bacterium]|nr:GNAT family N-acetyltransferase [Syntrophales bacterium]
MATNMKSSGDRSGGLHPEELTAYRKTRTGLELLLRPVKDSDEPLLRDLVHSLSDDSLDHRFFTHWREMLEGQVREMAVFNHQREMAIAAIPAKDGTPGKEEIIAVGRYYIMPKQQIASIVFEVRDDYQNQGVGQVLLSHLTGLARRQGLLGFTASVLPDNEAMFRVFEKGGFETRKEMTEGVVTLMMMFKQAEPEGTYVPEEPDILGSGL